MSEPVENLGERIVRAAADLLTEAGVDAVSTRAVSARAGVQAPAIYRQFGDMQELTRAAAREVLARYIRHKTKLEPSEDPLEDLRQGWDSHVEFGLANPAAFTLLYADSATSGSQEARDGQAVLEARVSRLALAGMLRVSVSHAVRVIRAGGIGVTLSLITTPEAERDLSLSEAVREALFGSLLVAPKTKVAKHADVGVAARAVALRAALAEAPNELSPAERQLLTEWLDRLARSGAHKVSTKAAK